MCDVFPFPRLMRVAWNSLRRCALGRCLAALFKLLGENCQKSKSRVPAPCPNAHAAGSFRGTGITQAIVLYLLVCNVEGTWAWSKGCRTKTLCDKW